MCRLFAQIAPEPRSPEDFLADAPGSLLTQSNAKRSCLQRDGWGLGWHDAKGRAVIEKSPAPIYREEAKLRDAAKRASGSRIVIGHVRAASNPLKLDKARILNLANTQPFTDGRWIFAHNGTLHIPLEVKAALGPLAKRVRSDNDSEVYFWHLLKHLRRSASFAEAAQKCLLEILDIWDSCKRRHPGKTGPYSSVNALLSDGKELHAVCHSAAKGMAQFGVCNPDQPWSQMSFARRGGRLILASEDMDEGAWTRLSPPEALTARIEGGRATLARARLSGLPQMALPREEAVA